MNVFEWHGSVALFKTQQEQLREQVDLRPLTHRPRTIGGADVSLNRGSKTIYAGIVVLDYETLEPIAYGGLRDLVEVPYIPGFLSFREVPALFKAWQLLEVKPDVIMLDGQGILHPRSLGVASHFGVVSGVPTLGCAKKPLVGEFAEPAAVGEFTPVTYKNEKRGHCYRSRKNARPIFISPGTGMSIEDAFNITRHCLRGYRLPEPTRLAHEYVNQLRTRDME